MESPEISGRNHRATLHNQADLADGQSRSGTQYEYFVSRTCIRSIECDGNSCASEVTIALKYSGSFFQGNPGQFCHSVMWFASYLVTNQVIHVIWGPIEGFVGLFYQRHLHGH